jgi:hypothetical protein
LCVTEDHSPSCSASCLAESSFRGI